jgi:uncharacterized protein YutE (UPF0331/DUF86 family)
MAYESPLFQSSLELFAHSIEHFNWGTEKDRKFVILHLANAVELIFKDLLLDLGESIYKNPKETITITGAIETLKAKGIIIPALNKLELLIEERNALQHRFGFPNELTTIFYMEATHHFFKEFLKNNYNLYIDTILEDFLDAEELANFQLRKVSTKNELDKLLKLTKVHPVGALLSANAYLERLLGDIKGLIEQHITQEDREIRHHIFHIPWSADIIQRLFPEYEIELDESIYRKLKEFRALRNYVAHGRQEPEGKQVSDFINLVKEIEPKIKELKEKVTQNPRLLIEREMQQKINSSSSARITAPVVSTSIS